MALGGAAQGFLDFTNQSSARAHEAAQTERLLQMLQHSQWLQRMTEQDRARKLDARARAGAALTQMFPGSDPSTAIAPPPTGGPQPPAPGEASVPMQPGPLGIVPPGQPPPAAIGPQVGPPPPMTLLPDAGAAPAGPPPGWRPMPRPMPTQGGGGIGLKPTPDMLAPPPPSAAPEEGAAPAGAAPGVAKPERSFNIPQMIQGFKAQGVPPEQIMDMLDELAPVMNATNKAELESYKLHNQGLSAAVRAYEGATRLYQAGQRIDETARRNMEKADEAQQRIKIAQRRLDAYVNKAAGGSNNVKNRQYIQDEDGNAIGTRAITQSGKILQFDVEGNPMTAEQANVSPKAGTREQRRINSLRAELSTLQSSANPTPADKQRMEKIKADLRRANVPPDAPKAKPGAVAPKATPSAADDAWVKANPDEATKKAYRDRFGKEPPA